MIVVIRIVAIIEARVHMIAEDLHTGTEPTDKYIAWT